MKKTTLTFLFFNILTSALFAQKNILGFKNSDAQTKIEKDFDAQLSAKRIGQNIKLLSSVPHHLGSAGGKFVADEKLSEGQDSDIRKSVNEIASAIAA